MKIFALILIGWPIASCLFVLAWIGLHRVGWHGPYVPDQAYADGFARNLSGSASHTRPSLPGAEPDTTIVYTVPTGPRGVTARTTPDATRSGGAGGIESRHLHPVP